MSTGPKILLFDIETAPIEALVWRIWKENVGIEQIGHDWYILCWAAKWLGKREMLGSALPDWPHFYRQDPRNDKRVCLGLWDLMNEADAVVAHNGDRFDIAKVNARFIAHELDPPDPYQRIDTLKIAKQVFGFTSNKLDHLGRHLGVGRKIPTGGFELWKGCLDGDEASWEKMVRYNKQDVRLLEDVYLKLRPWSRSHPNWGLYVDSENPVCPKCGGEVIKKGVETTKTNMSSYQRYRCKDCGAPSRGRTMTMDKDQRSRLLANVM